MSDTIQLVSWALRQACKLRCGDAQCDISAARQATGDAETFGRYIDKPDDGFGIFDDVLVTALTYVGTGEALAGAGFFKRRQSGQMYSYPSSGFVISHAFAEVGGPEGLRAMCGGCRANATSPRPAGCTGNFYQDPFSPQTQEQLESILSRLGLADAHARHFTATNPIWFGLWTRSPLTRDQIDVLLPVLGAMLDDDDDDSAKSPEQRDFRLLTHHTDLRRFIRAMELSLEHNLELHVSLAPPGHADLGWNTTFPHCPLCKAEAAAADVQRWQHQYPTNLRPCRVCGTMFSPAEMARSERMTLNLDSTDLRQVLGPQPFAAFARSYLMANGANEDLAGRLVETAEAQEAEHRAKFEAQRRRTQRQMRFVREKLLTDLHPTYGPDDDDASLPKFDAGEFEQVLDRCARMGIRITFISHSSDQPDRNLFENCGRKGTNAAAKVFAKWRKMKCDELFGAGYDVPEELLPPE